MGYSQALGSNEPQCKKIMNKTQTIGYSRTLRGLTAVLGLEEYELDKH